MRGRLMCRSRVGIGSDSLWFGVSLEKLFTNKTLIRAADVMFVSAYHPIPRETRRSSCILREDRLKFGS